MSIKDPISDFFTRIRNALMVKHGYVGIPSSRIKLEICRILKEEGFIKDFSLINEDLTKKKIRITLKYRPDGAPVISSIYRKSKSSKRIYVKKASIPKVRNGFGMALMSTSKGILSGKEARLKNVGGELLGEMY
jgi:small subunit ribosomal protein S8